MNIKFSPPDITQAEIDEVVDTLKSGWITTGPKTKEFERQIAAFCGTNKAVCLNSATAGLELVLRELGVGPGDEVITSAYTYTASASVINHVGAKIVLCDLHETSGYEMDYNQLSNLITNKTKVIIPVDIAGKICDYSKVFDIVEQKKNIFQPKTDLQKAFGRIIVLADAAHSFGAEQNERKSGNIADFTSFSFHAVKNLTTAEGGAITWRQNKCLDDDKLYKDFMLYSLHGQSKDALAKNQLGAWEYDIKMCGQKCNMTDIMASIGLAQLKRYKSLLNRRKEIIKRYNKAFSPYIDYVHHYGDNYSSSGHLYLANIKGICADERNEIIVKLAKKGIATNVHYKPLPMHTAYKDLGFNINDFPNAYAKYKNEITLPLHTLLSDEEVDYIINTFIATIKGE